jgi:restriction system protein
MNTPSDQNDVSAALALLRDSLAEEEQRIRNEGAKAMQGGDYDTATSVIDFAKRLLTFQKKVETLVSEWDELEDLRDGASPAVQEIVSLLSGYP